MVFSGKLNHSSYIRTTQGLSRVEKMRINKPMKHLDHPNAWSWLGAAEGIELEGISLAQAADRAVSQLERRRDAGLPLHLAAVQLAALLVRLEGEMVAAGATSPEPFIERAYARARAVRLGEQFEAGLRTRTKCRRLAAR